MGGGDLRRHHIECREDPVVNRIDDDVDAALHATEIPMGLVAVESGGIAQGGAEIGRLKSPPNYPAKIGVVVLKSSRFWRQWGDC